MKLEQIRDEIINAAEEIQRPAGIKKAILDLAAQIVASADEEKMISIPAGKYSVPKGAEVTIHKSGNYTGIISLKYQDREEDHFFLGEVYDGHDFKMPDKKCEETEPTEETTEETPEETPTEENNFGIKVIVKKIGKHEVDLNKPGGVKDVLDAVKTVLKLKDTKAAAKKILSGAKIEIGRAVYFIKE
jgi:hypothetical protein